MNPEEIIQKYLAGQETGQDNQLRAAVGKLLADRSKELSDSIIGLHRQIPVTVSELRQTISINIEKIIKSNERLAESNNNYAKWMKYLTLALVLVGVVQIVVTSLK